MTTTTRRRARPMKSVQIPKGECVTPSQLAREFGLAGPHLYAMLRTNKDLQACTFKDPLTGKTLLVADEAREVVRNRRRRAA